MKWFLIITACISIGCSTVNEKNDRLKWPTLRSSCTDPNHPLMTDDLRVVLCN